MSGCDKCKQSVQHCCLYSFTNDVWTNFTAVTCSGISIEAECITQLHDKVDRFSVFGFPLVVLDVYTGCTSRTDIP